ncbi:hypothetical protein GQ54DRAFT_305160 [Martensiomyces pterosporus]|nr:hypothetical protein GQ54DRAFT_305160 [Martensiomyces pterosporus]
MPPINTAATRDGGDDSTPDEDQGVIRCICGIDDDDGFTIQCENCLVWQHAVCVGVEQDNVPDEYLCEKCNPRKLDVKKAIEYQKRRLDSEYRHTKESRRKPKYVSGKARKAEDGSERRKRISDTKQSRTKHTKGMAGRESASPTAARASDHRRDSTAFVDAGYTPVDRNILGADVQVLFQSVLSQLAEQRSVVSAAAASVTASPVMGHVENDGALEPQLANGAAPLANSSSGSSKEAKGERTESMDTRGPVNPAPALPAVLPMTSDALSSPQPTYTSFVGKEHGQVGLFARERMERHQYVCEYKGQVILKAAYKEDPKNYYDLLRTTRPHSHFHPDIDLCVDARRQGSEARFIRRSCKANIALKSIFVPGGGDALIHLGLFTVRDVEPDEELTVGWEWEEGELPAVARLSPGDAEDYLGRPEGRRMSKVWRQAFNGMSCACPDTQCVVRRLFAMFGVEETAIKPEFGNGAKRRASRPPKVDTGAHGFADSQLSSPLSPSIRSPDGYKHGRNPHSRKTSDAGPHDSNGYGNAAGMEGAPEEADLAAADYQHQNPSSYRDGDTSDDEHGGRRSTNGQPGTVPMDFSSSENGSNRSADRRTRKRKSGNQHADESNSSLDSLIVGKDSVNKRHRPSSGSPARRGSVCHLLPQKKIWMTQYLEHAEPLSSAHAPLQPSVHTGNMTIVESPTKQMRRTAPHSLNAVELPSNYSMAVPTPDKPEPKVETAIDNTEGASASSAHISQSTRVTNSGSTPTSSTTVDDSKGALSPPGPLRDAKLTDASASAPPTEAEAAGPAPAPVADAGVPKPSDKPTEPPQGALSAGSRGSQSASPVRGLSEKPEEPGGAGKVQQTPSVAAEDQQAEETDMPTDSKAATAPASQPAPAPKKQRLSLEEYNKRRRVTQAVSSNREAQANNGSENAASDKQPAASNGTQPDEDADSAKQSSPAKGKVSLEEYNRRRKLGSAAVDSNAGQPSASSETKPVAPLSLSASAESNSALSPTYSALTNGPTSLVPPPSNPASELASPTPSMTIKSAANSAQPSASPVPAIVTDAQNRGGAHSRVAPTPPPASAPVFSKTADTTDRRGLLTPPPPPPPPLSGQPAAWRHEDRAGNGASSSARGQQGGLGEPYYRLERSSGAHDDYDRDRADKERDSRDRERDRDYGRDFDYRERSRSRNVNTPPPPPLPPASSNSALQGHVYRSRDRDHNRDRDRDRDREREREYAHRDASAERESGEIPFGRDRGRSRSRDRGGRAERMGPNGDRERDRDRRYGSGSGSGSGSGYHYHYHQPPQAGGLPPPPHPLGRSLTPHGGEGGRGSQRGSGDWRPGSYPPPQRASPPSSSLSTVQQAAAGHGPGTRALSTSPVQHQHHQSSSSSSSFGSPPAGPLPGLSATPAGTTAPAGAGGYRGFSRRGGVGTNNSRGGSPARK